MSVGHDGDVEVRKALVERELDALGVDHDEAELLGRGAHEHRHDEPVEEDRLARSGGARHEEVRQRGDVHDDGLALGVAPEGALERSALDVGHEVAEVDGLRLAVWNLDAHERGPGDGREDADRTRRERERDVVGEVRDLVDALALAHLDLEGGDRGTRDPADDAARQAELQERVLKLLRDAGQLLLRGGGGSGVGVELEHVDGRELVAAVRRVAARQRDALRCRSTLRGLGLTRPLDEPGNARAGLGLRGGSGGISLGLPRPLAALAAGSLDLGGHGIVRAEKRRGGRSVVFGGG